MQICKYEWEFCLISEGSWNQSKNELFQALQEHSSDASRGWRSPPPARDLITNLVRSVIQLSEIPGTSWAPEVEVYWLKKSLKTLERHGQKAEWILYKSGRRESNIK